MKHFFVSAAIIWCGTLSAKALFIETIRSPHRTPSTGVIIHKQTQNFVDIEAPVERVWVGCSTIDPKKETSYLGIEVEDEEIRYSFGPRRAVHDVPMCLAEEKKYREMMKGVKTVRVVGVTLDLEENVPPKQYKNNRTPRRFSDKPKKLSSFFVRLQAGEKCRAYFRNGCDLPKNYWSGATPVE